MYIVDNKFNFSMDGKPIQTDTIIPNDSNRPYFKKIYFLNSIFCTLERIPLK